MSFEVPVEAMLSKYLKENLKANEHKESQDECGWMTSKTGQIWTHTKQYKKGQLSLTNPRDACETFARFM